MRCLGGGEVTGRHLLCKLVAFEALIDDKVAYYLLPTAYYYYLLHCYTLHFTYLLRTTHHLLPIVHQDAPRTRWGDMEFIGPWNS